MQFKVTKVYTRGSEIPMAEFAQQKEAIHFIQEKLVEDNHYNVNASYQLYDFSDLLQTFTQADIETSSTDSSSGSTSTGQRGSSQSFAPTPFNTAPRPSGMPHSWIKDEENKDKK